MRTVARQSLALTLFALTAVIGASGVAHADAGMHTFRLEGGVGIPVTNPQMTLFDTGGGVGLSYELRPVPWIGIEARVSAFWLPTSDSNPSNEDFGSYYAPALGLRLHPLATMGVGDLWLGAAGAVVFTGDIARPGLEVGIGYEFDAAWWLRIGPFVRYHHVFQTSAGSDAGFVSVGLSLAFGGDEPVDGDRDGDGILNAVDACPDEPEDMDNFEDSDGCPDPDNDRDGILDGSDACPNDPEDMDGFEDTDGCPEADNDQDGILDGNDQCPLVAEDVDGWQDEDGCPDPDNDGDGILDAQDACPNEPETMNGFEDVDGCPDRAPPPPRTEIEIQLDQLGERIQFAQNRVQVLPASRGALRSVITLLRDHPEIVQLTIDAHASVEGTDEDNMALSQRRAETVVTALVRGGIARTRLVARAHGEEHPEEGGSSVQAGATEEDHVVNRRVSFQVQTAVVVPATP